MNCRSQSHQRQSILGSPRKLMSVIKAELAEIRKKYGIQERRRFKDEIEEIKVNLEVLVTSEDVYVTFSNEGYIETNEQIILHSFGRGIGCDRGQGR